MMNTTRIKFYPYVTMECDGGVSVLPSWTDYNTGQCCFPADCLRPVLRTMFYERESVTAARIKRKYREKEFSLMYAIERTFVPPDPQLVPMASVDVVSSDGEVLGELKYSLIYPNWEAALTLPTRLPPATAFLGEPFHP